MKINTPANARLKTVKGDEKLNKEQANVIKPGDNSCEDKQSAKNEKSQLEKTPAIWMVKVKAIV